LLLLAALAGTAQVVVVWLVVGDDVAG